MLHNENMRAKLVNFLREETQDLSEKHLGCRWGLGLIDIWPCEDAVRTEEYDVPSHEQKSISQGSRLHPRCFPARSRVSLYGKSWDSSMMSSLWSISWLALTWHWRVMNTTQFTQRQSDSIPSLQTVRRHIIILSLCIFTRAHNSSVPCQCRSETTSQRFRSYLLR